MERIIDGRKIAKDLLEEIKRKTMELKETYNKIPGLAVVLIGNDKASEVYANNIIKKCDAVGFASEKYSLGENTTEEEALELLDQLNNDDRFSGILIQFPLPKDIDEYKIKSYISEKKDVDGINPLTVGKLYSGLDTFIPCTPKASVKLLKSTGVELKGKDIVVIGRSNIVGRPVGELLLKENATITICHSKTTNLEEHTSRADVVVSAVGCPNLLKGHMLKKGSIVIDVGTNVVDGKLVGDTEFESAYEKVSLITPVPGGVGPVTITMLLENTLEAFLKQWELEL